MKKIFFFVAAVLVLSMVFVGCNAIINGDMTEYLEEKGLHGLGQLAAQVSEKESKQENNQEEYPEEDAWYDDATSETEFFDEIFSETLTEEEIVVDSDVIIPPYVETPNNPNDYEYVPVSELEDVTVSFKVELIEEIKYLSGHEIIIVDEGTGESAFCLELVDDKINAIIVEFECNSDGTVSLCYWSSYLHSDGINVRFSNIKDEHTKFVFEEAGDGNFSYFIKTNSTVSGESRYLKISDGFVTVAEMDESDVSSYIFKFTDPCGADGEVLTHDDPAGCKAEGVVE